MAVSEAKLEANRRNAQKSTGPRTDEGKKIAKMNATKHGLRAESLVVLDEDPQVLEDRGTAWRACLLPGDDVEERLVHDAVVYTWMQDRARRAQAGRINANIASYGVDQVQTNEKEVEDLGRRLFKDRLGPLEFYPSPSLTERYDFSRNPSTSFVGKGNEDDPDRPGALVLCLQSTLLGCEWMLGEWAKLKAIIDQGQAWLSSDKLKAVRLLGKQPFDAIDERDVAMVFIASFVLKPDRGAWYWEIAMELADADIKRFKNSAAVRELNSLKPEDAAKAREALLGIIERATERLTVKAEAHQERARLMAALASDFLAFDASPDGERLRRFDLASGRGLARSLSELRKHRGAPPLSVVSGPPLSVVSGPLSVASEEVDAIHRPDATNEAAGGPLAVVSGPLSVVSDPLADASGDGGVVGEANVTNEPTDSCENAANEPTDSCENTANEATDAPENATNEPRGGPLSVVSGPLSDASGAGKSVGESNVTNEATVAPENATNEPKHALESVAGASVVLDAGRDDRGEEGLEEGFSAKAIESIQRGCEKVRLARVESLRKLNEEARKEAEQAMALRRSRLREQRNPSGKPGRQHKGRTPCDGHETSREKAARKKREQEEFEKNALVLYDELYPALS
jgi:hypothetical protein